MEIDENKKKAEEVEGLDAQYSDNDILKLIEAHGEANAICEACGFDILYLRYRTQQISRKERRYIKVENLYKKSFASSVSPFVNTQFWRLLNEGRIWEQIEREGHSKRILGEKAKNNQP